MDSMFIWIVLFSGAAVLLLGLFLIASEKELKKKRGEINDLLTRLEDAPVAAAGAQIVDASGNGAEVTGLRAKNQELQTEMAALQDDLDAAHRAIDDLRGAASAVKDNATSSETQQLRSANIQLGAQIEELQHRLQDSEAQFQNAGASDNGAKERQTQLENSLIELKHQLEKSQAKIRELESSATPMVDISGIEAKHREDSQKLQTRIAELENSVRASADSARQIETLLQRMSESEKLEQELRAALRQHEEALPRWQERLAASDELKNRLLALQPVYDQLVAKQNSLIEHQRAYHGELKSFSQFLSASHDGTMAPTPMAAVDDSRSTISPQPASNPSPINGDVEITPKTQRGFGVFHAIIALVVSGALVALFLSQSGEQPMTHAAKPDAPSAPGNSFAPALVEQQTAAPNTAASTAPITPDVNRLAAPKVPVKPAQPQPAALAAAGTYEVTRSTRIFAAPTEFAQQIGEIEPGLKVNVVNARDGWLEIHSKHGRPPGFIRNEGVARIGG